MKFLLNLKTVFLALSIALASCQDPVQVEIEQKSKTLTVDAFLTTLHQEQVIRLSYTDHYFSGEAPPSLPGAEVTLRDLTNDKTYGFIDHGKGEYAYDVKEKGDIIFPGHTYELNVRYGHYQYRATTSCKRTASIDSLGFTKGGTDFTGQVKEETTLHLYAKDVTGPEADFYWVRMYKNGEFYGRPENMQLEHFGYNNEMDGQYFREEKIVTSERDGVVESFKGGDVVKVEILGISREAHDFLRLGVQMGNNTGLFATTSVNLPTNILSIDSSSPKAVGFFSVSDVSSAEAVCRESLQ